MAGSRTGRALPRTARAKVLEGRSRPHSKSFAGNPAPPIGIAISRRPRAPGRSRFWRPRFADRSFLRYQLDIWEAGKGPHAKRSKDFVKTLTLLAALAALTLTASTTCAAVIDLSNVLGPSGGYTTQAYYQGMLGGQPMTAAQQAYAGQQDQLRQFGFLSEMGGDIALGQIFYHIAYGITPPPSALDLASGEVTFPLLPSRQAASSLALRTWPIRAPA